MKRFSLIALTIVAFAACKKSDNSMPVKEEEKPFIGKWIGKSNEIPFTPFTDTLVFSPNQSFEATSIDSWYAFKVMSADSISFSFRNSRISGNRAYKYTFENGFLIIKCWVPSAVGSCYDVTFTKQ